MKTTFIANLHQELRLGHLLRSGLQKPEWTEFKAAIAFVKQSGTRYVVNDLAAFVHRGRVSISVGIDHGGSSVEGLTDLLQAVGTSGDIWVFKNPKCPSTFHPKMYVFKNAAAAEVLIGSGNLTKGGLYENYEGTIRLELNLTNAGDAVLLKQVEDVLDYWSTPKMGLCLALNERLIARLRKTGELPTEEQLAKRIASAARKASAPGIRSPFTGEEVQRAPKEPAVSSTESAGNLKPSTYSRQLVTCKPRIVIYGRKKSGGPPLRATKIVEASGRDVAECVRTVRKIAEHDIFRSLALASGFVETIRKEVKPPTGLLARGGISHGFAPAPDGSPVPVFVSRQHRAGAPAPAAFVEEWLAKKGRSRKR